MNIGCTIKYRKNCYYARIDHITNQIIINNHFMNSEGMLRFRIK